MFFFRNTKGKETSQNTRALARIEKNLAKLAENFKSGQEASGALQQAVQQAGEDVRKHDLAIENLLDMLDEQLEDGRARKLKEQEHQEEREKLLSLVDSFQEKFWQVGKFLSGKDESWAAQFRLAEQDLIQAMEKCGAAPVGQVGENVDYSIHEVIEILDTENGQDDKKVAAVLEPGCIYRGNVRKKAKVTVYRLKSQESENV